MMGRPRCPGCGYVLKPVDWLMEDGDVSVCYWCGKMLVRKRKAEGRDVVERLSVGEFNRLDKETQQYLLDACELFGRDFHSTYEEIIVVSK